MQNFVTQLYFVRYTTHKTLLITIHSKYRFIIEHFIDDETVNIII